MVKKLVKVIKEINSEKETEIVFSDLIQREDHDLSHLIMLSFMNNENFINPVKENTCFKGKVSCINLILTSRRHSFKYTSSNETGLNGHHHLISSMMKTTFEKEDSNILVYRDYKNFNLTVLHQNYCLNLIKIM